MSDDMNHSEAAEEAQLAPGNVSDGSDAEKLSEREEKTRSILEACSRKDIASLQTLAQSSGGLLSDPLRQKACMSGAADVASCQQTAILLMLQRQGLFCSVLIPSSVPMTMAMASDPTMRQRQISVGKSFPVTEMKIKCS